jgi:hypothetical protein
MRRRWALLGTSVMAAAVATIGGTADAGGWAITMVDPFAPPVVGEPLNVSFTILQHGRTPVDVDGVVVVLAEPDGDRRQFPAEPAGEVGRYLATVELVEPGRHHWSVVQGWFGEQDLGGLDVAADDHSGAGWSSVAKPAAAAALVGGAGIIGAVGITAHRRRLRRASVT